MISIKLFKEISAHRIFSLTLETIMDHFVSKYLCIFQTCLSNSKDWEQKLLEALRLWKNLQVKAEPVESFVTQADEVLTIQAETPMETLQTHKVNCATK